MNSKILYGAALSALMLTACSQDNVLDQPARTDAISFAVTNGATSRAAQSFCNTSMPGSFNIVAHTEGGDKYIEDVANRDSETSTSYSTAADYYWPESKLTFHAYLNDGGTYSYDADGMHFNNLSPANNVASQVDLIYAVAANQGKKAEAVKLNFRHPLSQIVFSARNDAKSYSVAISGVTIGHLNNRGSYVNDLKESTDLNYENHTWNPDVDDEKKILKGQGTWTLNGSLQRYSVSFNEVNLDGDFTAEEKDKDGYITLTDVDHKGTPDGSMILLPQTQGKWDPADATKTVKDTEGYNGAYFLLDVVFSQKGTDGSQIYSGKIAVPVDIEWLQGHRYRYRFVFTDGQGGFIPDPENPQPVLLGVKYDVSVDDFVPVVNNPINPGNNPGTSGSTEPQETTFTVNYNANGGNGTMNAQTTTVAADYAEFTVSDNAFTKTGSVFTGWNTAADGTGTSYTAGATISVSASAPTVTLYAQWNELQKYNYSVKVVNEDGSEIKTFTKDNTTDTSVTFDLSTVTNPEKYGYTLTGWTDGKNNYPAQLPNNFQVSSTAPSITLRPVFTEIAKVKYTVTLNPNGGNGDVIVLETNEVLPGEEAVVVIPKQDFKHENTDWDHRGYSLNPLEGGQKDESGVTHRFGQTYKFKANATLHAVYVDMKSGSGGGGQISGNENH